MKIPKPLVIAGVLGAAAFTAAAQCGAAAPKDAKGPGKPRLVVVVSIDQCRADYITRFRDLYLPAKDGGKVGGFRYLQSRGAWYADCRYEHARTVTAVGHSIIGTGAQPSLSGVVGNDWFNRETGKSVYSTDDPNSTVVGAQAGSRETPMSPANQMVTTVSDELETATGGRAKTVGLSLKDRAAILMAGHRADTVIWYDEDTGGMISSSFYCKENRLPEWVNAFNNEKLAAKYKDIYWEPRVDDEALAHVWNPERKNLRFRRQLKGVSGFGTSPYGNEFILTAAKRAVEGEELGKDEVPDILDINLASNDYVGHAYGPDSPEVLDISVQTDRLLADFLNYLDGAVTGGLKNVTFVISSDHGVVTVPELNSASGVPASRAVIGPFRSLAEKALDDKFTADDWIVSTANGDVYFNDATLAKHPEVTREALENVVVETLRNERGVYFVIGKTAVLSGRVPRNELGSRITHTVHPQRSGDVIVILNPNWLAGSAPTGTGSSHGTPFTYDTHVPLLISGAGVKPGVYTQQVGPAHIAPSLSFLVGCARPSGAESPILPGFVGAPLD